MADEKTTLHVRWTEDPDNDGYYHFEQQTSRVDKVLSDMEDDGDCQGHSRLSYRSEKKSGDFNADLVMSFFGICFNAPKRLIDLGEKTARENFDEKEWIDIYDNVKLGDETVDQVSVAYDFWSRRGEKAHEPVVKVYLEKEGGELYHPTDETIKFLTA